MNIQKRTAESGDVYAYYIEKLHKYGAYQVIRVNQESKSICYIALDYLGNEPPELMSIESLQPYYRQAFRWNHNIVKELINNSPVPRDYLFIGQCSLKTDDKCNTFAGGWPKGLEYIYEERWKAFDENARAAYKKYCNSGDFVTVKGKMFRKNKIGLTDDLYQCLTEKDSLKDFPCIIFAEVNGYSGKLVKWCRETPLLAKLKLKNAGVELLDLSDTHLDHLELDLSGVKRLVLPESLVSLQIYGNISNELQIDDRLCAERIELRISAKSAHALRFGMNNVKISMLKIDDITELDLQPVAGAFPEVEDIRLDGRPGTLSNLRALGQMHGLKNIYVQDLFGYGSQDLDFLSELPGLRELDFDSIPKEAGVYLKKKWKGKLDICSITHLREEGWMRENLENPLRHWDGSEFVPAAAYKGAVKCYKDTKKSLEAAHDRAEIEMIVRQYTRKFNELNEKYDEFIETEEREDIFAAMQQLYEECILHGKCGETDETNAGITLGEIWNIMDGERDDW